MPALPNKVKIYIATLSILAVTIIYYFSNHYDIANLKALIHWSILAITTESLLILMPNGAGVSVGFAIGLASLITEGPLVATVVTTIGFVFRVIKDKDNKLVHLFNVPFYKTLFNASQSIIFTGLSSIVYINISNNVDSQSGFILAVLITLIVYMLLNTLISARLFSFISSERFLYLWVDYIKMMLPRTLSVGALGVIMALSYREYGFEAVLLFFGPLLLARYSFKMYMDMRIMYMETIQALSKTIEAKDKYTCGHANRVKEYAVKLARVMNLTSKQVENIETAALLHDIGKIGIDDNILKKEDKLTKEEYDSIKQHPVIGANILKDVDFLKNIINIVKYHHERYDAKGYPEGLSGDDIPIEAAILSLADAFDAMTSDRPYRQALSKEKAIDEIKSSQGRQFHPKLAQVFIDIIKNEIEKENKAHAN